ncbi:Protein of unknown function [Bacteroides faecichinchillae]|uniref:DUF3408 domain-containing protein n=2 Tax=Bacteroides faecichinchillae TaxID=871325 RepID=A0A1M4TQE0_9BACE|nr:Protein of unknown function [Bacteroides faecichinchillae]
MVFLHSRGEESAGLPEKLSNYLKYGIMVKRKEVKIDEEQIRRVMAGDIPASVLENRYGNNAAGSQKEDGKEPENRSGIPVEPDKVEAPGSGVSGSEEETPSQVLREKTCRKKNSLQEYPEHLFGNNVVKERRQTYVSSENYERVRTLLSVIAPTLSISCYIDNILSAHLEQYRDELNAIYSSRINLKPL